MMPAWAWWGLIAGGLCGLSWLYGRLSRQQAPAGNGPWDTSWAVYFSPNGGATHAILEGIRGAKYTILVHAYLLYSTRLAGGLVRAHQRGVRIHVILDANAQPHYPPVPAVALLVAAGIAVSLDARHEWAHDKVMILDGEIVITGSYNWTVAAEKHNGENLLVIRDPRLAGLYTENWRRHAHHSTPYRPTAPWWVRIRVVWVSLTRRRRKRLGSDIGEDG
jgi:phosphatidylserine/phosphatidylglycerophosphate/cardiolipin synthase-like enzyme